MAKNKALVQETKTEITGAPVTNAKPVPARTIQAKLNTQSANDPICTILERRERNGSIDIDNTGRAILRIRNHDFEINDVYETQDEKRQAALLQKNCVTGLSEAQSNFLFVHQIYHPKESVTIIDQPSAARAPAGYSVGYSLKGNNGTSFTAIHDQTGKLAYYDTGKSCVMPSVALAAATPAARNDGLIDAGQSFNINYKIKDGKVLPKTAEESALALTLARIDNNATKLPSQLDMIERITDQVVREATENTLRKDITKGGTFSSSIDSGIKTDLRPSTPFETAIFGITKPDPSRSIMFQPKEAQNDLAFKLKA